MNAVVDEEDTEAPNQPLSEVAYQALSTMLLGGELEPNEVITERQIALRLGLSRTPVREALRDLEHERTVRIGDERDLAGKRFVQDHTQRIQVRGGACFNRRDPLGCLGVVRRLRHVGRWGIQGRSSFAP